ncbi:MAG: HTTM domain-containing protein [Solirubrobacterales bacterium]
MSVKALLTRQVDARPLALTRIVVGLSGIAFAVFVERRGLNRLAEEGIFTAPPTDFLPALTPGLVDVLIALWIAFGIALTLGLFARTSAAGVALVAGASIALDLQAFSNHVTLLIALSALLALGDPGAVWSLDARRRGTRSAVPYWPVFLLKFQVTTVYAYAALTKVNGSFLGAEVLASRWEPVVGSSPAGGVEAVLVGVAISTVLAEGFLAVGLWDERLRRIALPLGLGLHVAIPATLGVTLIPFSTMMLAVYVLFPDWLPGSRTVSWDAREAALSRFVGRYRRLDWFGIHSYVPGADARDRESAKQALVVEAGGDRVEGYRAVCALLEQSPVTFLVAPILRAPGISRLGAARYRRMAGAPGRMQPART